MSPRPVVTNAADPAQLKEAAEREAAKEQQSRLAMAAIMQLPEGRLVLWETLTFCRAFASVWDGSARIHYNSGQQDVGHYLMAKMADANPKAFAQMMIDNLKES